MQAFQIPPATAEWYDFFTVIIAGGDDLVDAAVRAAVCTLQTGGSSEAAVLAGMRAARSTIDQPSDARAQRPVETVSWIPKPPPLPYDYVRSHDPKTTMPRRAPRAITTGHEAQ